MTPLVELPALASELGVGRVLVKDESLRLGLPAFKVLGASWACHQVLLQQSGAELVTATDGNHGRAVARMAKHFGVAATVFVPDVMLDETAAAIEAEGAEVVRLEVGYDDAVRAAAAYAGESDGRALVQDTAWDGYTDVPGSSTARVGLVADLGMLGLSSGPSGAATLAGVRVALADPALRTGLNLSSDAVVVLLSTEAAPVRP